MAGRHVILSLWKSVILKIHLKVLLYW